MLTRVSTLVIVVLSGLRLSKTLDQKSLLEPLVIIFAPQLFSLVLQLKMCKKNTSRNRCSFELLKTKAALSLLMV